MNQPSKPVPMQQTKDYTCGPWALAYFLDAWGCPHPSVDALEIELGTTPEAGTDPRRIEVYLRKFGFPFVCGVLSLPELTLPLLVNYFDEDDGHYGVIVALFPTNLARIFNPASGEIEDLFWPVFVKHWFSPRYRPNWGLCMKIDA